MLWGAGWTSYWGDPESWVIIEYIRDLITGPVVKFRAIPEYPQYFQFVVDRRNQGSPFYVLDTATDATQVLGEYSGDSPHIVSIYGLGQWAPLGLFDTTWMELLFQDDRTDRILLTIKAKPSYFSIEDSGLSQFSGWSNGDLTKSGIVRFQNCYKNITRPTWGQIDLTMITVLGVHTVTGSVQGSIVCQGSRTGDGALVLAEMNSSGVVLNTTLAYTSDIAADNAVIVASFPQAYYIYYKLATDWVANDFPAGVSYSVTAAAWAVGIVTLTIGAHLITVGTSVLVSGISPKGYNNTENVIVTAVTGTTISFARTSDPGVYVSGGTIVRMPTAVINDNGRDGYYDFDSGPLANGTYHIVVHQVSAEDEESAGTVNGTLVVVSVPDAPTGFALNNPTGDVIQWTAVANVGATYNGYDSLDTGVIPVTANFTHVAGTPGSTLTKGLTALVGFTGSRYVVLRSALAGVESGNSEALEILYSAGVALLVRPNVPYPQSEVTVTGRKLTVNLSFDTRGQAIAADRIQLFAKPVGTVINYTTELGHTLLSSLKKVGLRYYGSISGTVGADGQYMYALRASSANGQSLNVDTYGPVELTTALPDDPTVSIGG